MSEQFWFLEKLVGGYNAMTTFSKVMNMPAPSARRIVTINLIQNEGLLPTVKQLANNNMRQCF